MVSGSNQASSDSVSLKFTDLRFCWSSKMFTVCVPRWSPVDHTAMRVSLPLLTTPSM